MTNWEAVETGSLDALGAAIMERTADQRDDPSSREQEYADACLALIGRCKRAERQRDEALEMLREIQYRKPRADMVAECIGCGARGPINERLRKMDPEPCADGCRLDAVLARSGRRDDR